MSDLTPDSATTEPTDLTEVGDWVGLLPKDKRPETRRHRIHQGIWRSEVAKWPAGPPQNDRRVRERYATLPNWLADTHQGRDVREDGPNLMSPEALAYAHERLAPLERIDGKAEPDRLWRNLLSSQPLAFSIAGHLQRHPGEAAALFASLTGREVSSLATLDAGDGVWKDHRLDGVDAEWFPPRAEHTRDMSGCDIAACLALQDGRRVLVTVEVKYTDTFSSAPVAWSPRYEPHLIALGLDPDSTAALVEAGCSQVLRQAMLTDSVRRHGVAPGLGPDSRVDDVIAVVLAREDDKTAQRVVETLDSAVRSIIPIQFWSHRHFFSQAAELSGLKDWSDRMTARYVVSGA